MRQKCDNKSMIILCEDDCRPCLDTDKVHAVPSANIPPGDPVHLVIAGQNNGNSLQHHRQVQRVSKKRVAFITFAN